MKFLRRIFYRVFPRYTRLELVCLSWSDAEKLLIEFAGDTGPGQWRIAPEEDHNETLGVVWLERRVRITE